MKKLSNLLLMCLFTLCIVGFCQADVSAAELKAKISVDCGTSAMKGDTITITGNKSGGVKAKGYKFKFRYKLNDKMYTIQPYGEEKTATFAPKKNGTYKFYVYVKNNGVVKTKTKTVTVKDLTATIKHNSKGVLNKSVTVTAGSSGGWGEKQYKITYTFDGNVKTLKGYSTANSVKFTPKTPGIYLLKVTVRDDLGRKVSKTKKLIIEGEPVAAPKPDTNVNTDATTQTKPDANLSKEDELRQNLVDVAIGWYGIKEGSAAHKEIVKIYNSEKNNMYRDGKYSHYTASIDDSWCDIFVSACFIKAGYQVISGVECGCEKHIELLNTKLASWVEDDAYVPKTGDIIFYDWGDSGSGNNKGWSDHVGIVVSCDGKEIKVIEGNMDGGEGKDKVGYRTVKVNGKYIRGFGVPKYSKLVK